MVPPPAINHILPDLVRTAGDDQVIEELDIQLYLIRIITEVFAGLVGRLAVEEDGAVEEVVRLPRDVRVVPERVGHEHRGVQRRDHGPVYGNPDSEVGMVGVYMAHHPRLLRLRRERPRLLVHREWNTGVVVHDYVYMLDH